MSKPPVKFYWKGPHHGYLGIILFGGGLLFLYLNWGNGLGVLNIIYGFLAMLGLYLMIDDLIEHTITEDTPARILWNKILGK